MNNLIHTRFSEEEKDKVLPCNELYCATQMEGSRQGYPTIVIRLIGCNLRCQFANGGFCDSWANSWKLEKGFVTFNDIIKLYDENPHITEMMITGGGPSKHPRIINELLHLAKSRNIFVTVETEGSEEIITDIPIDLVSISPKFSNSTPIVGTETPWGSIVTQKEVDRHEKFRINDIAIKQLIESHTSYHIKPVVNPVREPEIWKEVLDFIERFNIPTDKVWIMPPGDSREILLKVYPEVIQFVTENGYRFTGRDHIIAWDKQRMI